MMKILTLILITLLFANCKQGGEGSSTLTTITDNSKLSGDFIENDIQALSADARAILDQIADIEKMFILEDDQGRRLYTDLSIVSALKLYVNAFTETNDPLVVCDEMVDVFASFGLDSEVIEMNGSPHAFIPGGVYCLVDLESPNGNVAIDPVLNMMFRESDWLSVSELEDYSINRSDLSSIDIHAQGYNMAKGGWNAPSDVVTFHNSFTEQNFGSTLGQQDMRDFYYSHLNNITD